jgi:hypothetical protein
MVLCIRIVLKRSIEFDACVQIRTWRQQISAETCRALAKTEKGICNVCIHTPRSYALNLRPLNVIPLVASTTDIAFLPDSLRHMLAAPSSRLKWPKLKAGEPVQ